MSDPATDVQHVGTPSWHGLWRRDVVGALVRYRVMAFIVGTGLLLLVFVAVPLQYGAHIGLVAKIVGTTHGYLYIVYLVAAADLARRARWHLLRIVAVVAAGFLPFLAFIVEHRVYEQMKEEWAVDGIPGLDEGSAGAVEAPLPAAAGAEENAATGEGAR